MFLTPNLANDTTVQWQWRGGLANPSSGNFSDGPSLTVSGCPNVPYSYPSMSSASYTGPSSVNNGDTISFSITVTAGSRCLASIKPTISNGSYNQQFEYWITSGNQSCNLNPGETGTYTISWPINSAGAGSWTFDGVVLKDVYEDNAQHYIPWGGVIFTLND